MKKVIFIENEFSFFFKLFSKSIHKQKEDAMSIFIWRLDGILSGVDTHQRRDEVDTICKSWARNDTLPAIILAQEVYGLPLDITLHGYFSKSKPHCGQHTPAAVYCRTDATVHHIVSPQQQDRIECAILDGDILVTSWIDSDVGHKSNAVSMLETINRIATANRCTNIIVGGFFNLSITKLKDVADRFKYRLFCANERQPMALMAKGTKLEGDTIDQTEVKLPPTKSLRYNPICYQGLLERVLTPSKTYRDSHYRFNEDTSSPDENSCSSDDDEEEEEEEEEEEAPPSATKDSPHSSDRESDCDSASCSK